MSTHVGGNLTKEGLILDIDMASPQSNQGQPATNIINVDFDTSFETLTLGDTVGWTSELGTGGAYGVSSTLAYQGYKSLAVFQSAGDGRVYRATAVLSGDWITFSAWVFSTVPGPYLHIELYGGNYSWQGAVSATHSGLGWQWLSVTYPSALTSNATLYYFLYPGNNNQVYLDLPQVEKNPTGSPWVNGTRTSSQAILDLCSRSIEIGTQRTVGIVGAPTFGTNKLTIPNVNTAYLDCTPASFYRVGNGDFTINTWVKLLDTGISVLTEARGTSNYGWILVMNYPSANQVQMQFNSAAASSSVSSSSFLPQGTAFHLCAVVSRSMANIDFYLNGVLNNSQSITTRENVSLSGGDIYRIGYDVGGNTANFELYAYQHYNRAITAEEVRRNFSALRGRYGV